MSAVVTTHPQSAFGRFLRVAVQSAALAAIWVAADFVARKLALLALLFCGGVAPRWVKAGADWLLADMLLFFIPAAVAAVQYGGLFMEDGWRLEAMRATAKE